MRYAAGGLTVVLGLAVVLPLGADEDPIERMRALEGIRQAGGSVIIDETSNVRPVIQIDLSGERVEDSALRHARGFIYARTLLLNGSRVTDAGLEANFGRMEMLREVQLNYANVGDRGLQALGLSKNLTVLELSYTDVSDAGLAWLARAEMKKLQRLALSYTRVTDAGLVHLKKMEGLTHLYLDGTAISKAGLAHLSPLPLEVLSYSDTRAAAGGIDGFRKPPAAPPPAKPKEAADPP